MLPQAPRRLFIGLLPERELQARIGRHAGRWEWPPEARRTRFGRHHLTLHFLGEVPLAPEDRLRAALRGIACAPFDLFLGTPMSWQHGLAVLLPEPSAPLRELRERLADCLHASRLPAGPRAFTPHVTLARDATGARPPVEAPRIPWPVGGFELVWSRLDTRPAEYVVVERYRLAGPGRPVEQRPAGAQGELFL